MTDGVEILSTVRPIDFENAWYECGASSFLDGLALSGAHAILQGLRPGASCAFDVLEVGGGHGVARPARGATRWRVDLTDLNMASLSNRPPSRGRTLSTMSTTGNGRFTNGMT